MSELGRADGSGHAVAVADLGLTDWANVAAVRGIDETFNSRRALEPLRVRVFQCCQDSLLWAKGRAEIEAAASSQGIVHFSH